MWRWLQDDDEFADAVADAIESRIAHVEDALYREAIGGNITAIIFFLCNRKAAGWKHVQHIQHSGGKPYELHVTTTTDNDAPAGEVDAGRTRKGKDD
jgi:hypothetical protein